MTDSSIDLRDATAAERDAYATKELRQLGYPQNILESQQNGGHGLDLRLRFAMQLLTQSNLFGDRKEVTADEAAVLALNLSESLFAQAVARGWVTPFPDGSFLPSSAIEHAKRMGAFQYWQQMGANEAAQANAPRVAPVRPGLNG